MSPKKKTSNQTKTAQTDLKWVRQGNKNVLATGILAGDLLITQMDGGRLSPEKVIYGTKQGDYAASLNCHNT